MKYFYCILFFFVSLFSTVAQEYKEYIVEHNGSELRSTQNSIQGLVGIDLLSSFMHTYLYKFDKNTDDALILSSLNNLSYVVEVQPNRTADSRACNPNDPLFNTQYQMSIIKANETWCFAKNGLTPKQDTIVIGVVDVGVDTNHVDLKKNLWINYHEIPKDNLDNDGNGFIDDYRGYSASGFRDNHPIKNHGTNTSGTIGAIRDNNIGISGVMPAVKIVFCSYPEGSNNLDEIIKCYDYMISLRDQYDKSNGKKGAFVVAVNSSFGFSLTFPNESPSFCKAFETMGKYGILSAGATTNTFLNVEIDGDLPSLCTSEYLLTVTSTNKFDDFSQAGYSSKFIELGAPGDDIQCLSTNSNYSIESGTSLSTPMVASAVGILYQFCPKLTTFAKEHPDSAALLVQQFIIEGADAKEHLRERIKGGKRLNIENSVKRLLEWCDIASAELSLDLKMSESFGIRRFVITPKTLDPMQLFVYNGLGQLVHSKSFDGSTVPIDYDLSVSYWSRSAYYAKLYQSGAEVVLPFIVF